MSEPDGLPRIGLLCGSLSSAAGGVFFVLRDVANRLTGRGATVAAFGMRDATFDRDRAQWRIAELHAFDASGPRAYRMSAALPRALRTARLDVLHLHGIWNFTSLAALLWRRATRRPLVISPHGMLDPGALAFSSGRKRIFAALYERANLRGATAIHALNRAEARAIRAFGIDTPVAVIPNGVDLPDPARYAARDWSGDRRRTMLFLARIHPKKGVTELIDAWRGMLDRAPELGGRWRLTIAGWDDGGHLEAARRQVTALGLAAHVDLPGALFGGAKEEALAQAHAFILPSRSEGLPISVLEAWSYALPVLMTEACNLPSGFAADAAVPIDTAPDRIAATLVEMLGGPLDHLHAIGANGRALVERAFTWDSAVDDYLSLYRWAVRGGVPPSFVHFAQA